MSTLKVDNILDTSGNDTVAGKIIQVVDFSDAVGQYTSGSNTMANTGFGITITPKFANSKILVNVTASTYSSSHYCYIDLSKNGTSLSGSATNGQGFTGPVTYYVGYWQTNTLRVVDSPNTTSAVTYDIYGRTASGTLYVGSINSSPAFPNAVYITAMEIAQ